MKKSLLEMGFLRNGIVETILCTYDADRVPNAAPMGITTDDMESLILEPFTETLTYRNLLSSRCATINITTDSIMFYRTVLKDTNPGSVLPKDWFIDADIVNAPRLKKADAYLEVMVRDMKNTDVQRARFTCTVAKISQTPQLAPRVYCRAAFALIESVIHATRIKPLISQGDKEGAELLVKLVQHYADLAERVAPNSIHLKMINDILRRIESWKGEARKSM